MEDHLKHVAIVGAGLGGCALALSLTGQNISITVYESRPEISDVVPSGVMLTPNGLRVLDHLGVFERIRNKCYIPKFRIFKNEHDETTKKYVGSSPEMYGYHNHRIWRKTLFDEMRSMLKERGVEIQFNSRFHGIISDTEEGVTFTINDIEQSAAMLIGADGIYSAVRRALAPDIVPEYTGLMGILCHIQRSSVAWPYPEYESNATIQDKPGAIFWVAEDPEGEHLMIAKQVTYPQQTKADLEGLQNDPERLAAFFTERYEEYGTTARKIIDQVCENRHLLYIWPFMKTPRLERWYSETGRVILVGDGAHALPPSSGQGVNQALEDVQSLTLLLGMWRGHNSGLRNHGDYIEALAYWQRLRQSRVDAVVDWTNQGNNISRLPEAERKKILAESKAQDDQFDDMTWLYRPDVYDEMETWLQNHGQQNV